MFGSLIGFFAYFFILQRLTASTVALITLITPVIALTLGALLNNEAINSELVFGAILITLGLAIYHWGEVIFNKFQQRLILRSGNIKRSR